MMKSLALVVLVGLLQSSLVKSDDLMLSMYTVEANKSNSCAVLAQEGPNHMRVTANLNAASADLTFQNLGQKDNLTVISVAINGSPNGFMVVVNGTADDNFATQNFNISKDNLQQSNNDKSKLSSIYIDTTHYQKNKENITACFDAAFIYNATVPGANYTANNVTTTELGCWIYNINTTTIATVDNLNTTNKMDAWGKDLAKHMCDGAINVQLSLLAFILTAIVSYMNK